jgi:hypothetical protein
MKWALRVVEASLIVLAALTLATSGLAAAHVLKQDNGVAAVLHIPPDDNPHAGQTTELQLAFDSTGGTFGLSACHCQLAVESNGKAIQTVGIRPAAAGDQVDGVAAVRFPAAGVYQLAVTGSSTNQSFGSFQLDYLERVTAPPDTRASPAQNGTDVLLIGAGGLVILALLAYSAIHQRGRYRLPSDGSKGKKV